MTFSTINRVATAVSSTTNATSFTPSWTWTTNTAVPAGQLTRWVCFVSSDGNPTLSVNVANSAAGWVKTVQASDGTAAVTGAIFEIETTAAFATSAAPALQVDSSASEQYSATLYALTAPVGTNLRSLAPTSATGSSTNSDPPISSSGPSGSATDVTCLISRHGDSTVVATACDGNFSNLQTIAGGGTNGASTNSAQRNLNLLASGTQNPTVFTSATEQWVCFTHAVFIVFPNFIPRAEQLTYMEF